MNIAPSLPSAEVFAALQRVKEKTGERWTPTFVLSRVETGGARLFEIYDESHIAWIVVEFYLQGEAPWMNVWVLEGAGLDMAEEVLPLIDGLAKSSGCVAWRCTGREGWAKWLKPIARVYEREVL